MKRQSYDSKIYNTLLNVAFVAAAVISAYLNILMFTNLEVSSSGITVSKILLCGMSLTLEVMKVVTLLRKNTYEALKNAILESNPSVDCSRITAKKNFYFCVYIMFAVIAIFASIGFSLQTTHTTQSESSHDYVLYQNQYDSLSSQEETVEKCKNDYDAKKNLADSKSYELNDARAKVYSKEISWTEYNKINSDAKIAVSNSNEAKKLYDTENSKMTAMIQKYGGLWQIKENLQNAKDEQIKTEGSSGMFTLIADTFGIEKYVQQLRFVILLLISVLIELTIYMTSSDINLDKALLKKFRKDFPKNMDKTMLFSSIEKEQELYSYSDNIKLSREERKILKSKIDEAVEKASENQDKKNKKHIERISSEYIDQISILKGNIKSLKEQLDQKAVPESSNDAIADITKETKKSQKKAKEKVIDITPDGLEENIYPEEADASLTEDDADDADDADDTVDMDDIESQDEDNIFSAEDDIKEKEADFDNSADEHHELSMDEIAKAIDEAGKDDKVKPAETEINELLAPPKFLSIKV